MVRTFSVWKTIGEDVVSSPTQERSFHFPPLGAQFSSIHHFYICTVVTNVFRTATWIPFSFSHPLSKHPFMSGQVSLAVSTDNGDVVFVQVDLATNTIEDVKALLELKTRVPLASQVILKDNKEVCPHAHTKSHPSYSAITTSASLSPRPQPLYILYRNITISIP